MTLALGRHLLQSTLFVLIVGLLALWVRRHGAATRHMMWLIAAAKFVLPTTLLSLLGSSLADLLPSNHISASVPAVLSRWITSQAISEPSKPTDTGGSDLLILIWLLGCAVMFIVWLPQLGAAVNLSGSPERPQQDSFLRWKQRIGLRREVKLRFSDSVGEPVLAGFWKPAVMIPRGLSGILSSAELDSVILHELAHAKRRDNWTAAFAHVVTCIFWFYPLLWWIEKRLHRERELACDEMVVRYGASPDDYVAGILKVCRFHLSEDLAGISGVCGSNLKNRMEAIMSFSAERPLLRAPRALLGILIAAVAVVPLLVGFLAASNSYGQAAKESNQRTNQPKAENPIACFYADVAYPEGTVIQQADLPERMCARVLSSPDRKDPYAPPTYHAQWIPTSKAIRERSLTIVHLAVPPAPSPFSCLPKPPTQENLCTCGDGADFSHGALVNSSRGPLQLRCDHGNWVQTATPNIKRK
jgi:beta-lactamase regulating signal transducer with metallopeptidase domain